MLIDLEVKRKSKEFSYDIIIIGAGASGITCANKINQLNKSMTPIKVYEVLNFGLPIVSVDLDEIKFITKKYILFSNDKEIIIKNLIKAVQTDSIQKKKKRIQFVKPYSWDNRFKVFKKIIN